MTQATPTWPGARSIVTADGNKIQVTGGNTRFLGAAGTGAPPRGKTVATLRAERPQVFTITPRAVTVLAATGASSEEHFQNWGPAMLVRYGVGQADVTIDMLAVQPLIVVADNIDVIGHFTNIGGNLRPGAVVADWFARFKCDFRCFIGPGEQPTLPPYWYSPYNGYADRFFITNNPGVLRSAVGHNAGASRVYVMFFDWTALGTSQYAGQEVPDGSSPDLAFPVDPGQAFSWDDRHGFPFGTGLAWYASSTPTILTKDATAQIVMSASFRSLTDNIDAGQV